MDQQIIANFKKLYTKALFQRCFEVTNETSLTLTEFWKEHFHILSCVRLINKAWAEVSKRTLTAGWRNLWPDGAPLRDFEGFDAPSQLGDDPEAEPLPLLDADVEEIVSVAKSMGLEVSSDDVEELVAEHNTELTTEELQELHKEQQKVLAEEVSEEEESKEVPTTGTKEIKEMLMHWEKFQEFFEKYHHDKAVVNRAIDYVDDNLVNVYRKHLKKRQQQTTLYRFFSKEENQPGPSAKKQRKEESPEEQQSDCMEGDSPSNQ
ncbi:tigger transposable element-derived protein 1-like [Macrobrachium rosenbergii]|uniref:tigger transposable element-derived protein 1-like n=1 Tax=Macrobrachium rosenbergii TaxID=79674 RepID=UPI0034D588DD